MIRKFRFLSFISNWFVVFATDQSYFFPIFISIEMYKWNRSARSITNEPQAILMFIFSNQKNVTLNK